MDELRELTEWVLQALHDAQENRADPNGSPGSIYLLGVCDSYKSVLEEIARLESLAEALA